MDLFIYKILVQQCLILTHICWSVKDYVSVELAKINYLIYFDVPHGLLMDVFGTIVHRGDDIYYREVIFLFLNL